MQNIHSQGMILNVFLKKIILQNRYVEPPFMEKNILNFHFDYLHPSLRHHGSIVWLNIIINIIVEFRPDKRTKYHPIQNSICVNFIGYFPITVHFAPPPIEMGNIQKLFLATQENIRSGTGGKFPRCRFHTWQDFSDRVRGSKSTFHTSIILKENKVAKLRWTQNKL